MHFKKYQSVILMILALNSEFAAGANMKELRPWFTNKNCKTLEIKKFKSVSNHDVTHEILITDVKAVEKIMTRIEKISANGDMMVSFGPDADFTQLIFNCESADPKVPPRQIVEIYQKGFKTPSTGFNSEDKKTERALIDDLFNLLSPDVNKKLLKIENLEYKIDKFSVTFKGSDTKTAPVTVTTHTETYIVKDKTGNEQKVEITSGQLPPKPEKFEVNKHQYSLQTLNSSKGESLLPDYFEITK